jgi:hypothetical protein
MLLELGCDAHLWDKIGKTASDVASFMQFEAIAEDNAQ